MQMYRIILIPFLLLSCTQINDFDKPCKGYEIIGCTGELNREICYLYDPTTKLCFASRSPHGFACVPCDSLKNITKTK